VGQIRPERQTLLFSATMPRKVEHLIRDVLSDPIRMTVGEVRSLALYLSPLPWRLVPYCPRGVRFFARCHRAHVTCHLACHSPYQPLSVFGPRVAFFPAAATKGNVFDFFVSSGR